MARAMRVGNGVAVHTAHGAAAAGVPGARRAQVGRSGMMGLDRLLAMSEGIGIATAWRLNDGQRISVRRVVCAACGATAEKRHKPNAPPDQVKHSFERARWSFGKRVLCSGCSRRRSIDITEPNITETSADAPPQPQESVPMAALKPRAPTVKEVLRISDELDLNFIDGRYRVGLSDQALADRLQIPRVIVTQVREEGYGPIKGDPEIEALRSDLETFGGLLADFSTRLAKVEARKPNGSV